MSSVDSHHFVVPQLEGMKVLAHKLDLFVHFVRTAYQEHAWRKQATNIDIEVGGNTSSPLTYLL